MTSFNEDDFVVFMNGEQITTTALFHSGAVILFTEPGIATVCPYNEVMKFDNKNKEHVAALAAMFDRFTSAIKKETARLASFIDELTEKGEAEDVALRVKEIKSKIESGERALEKLDNRVLSALAEGGTTPVEDLIDFVGKLKVTDDNDDDVDDK